MRILHVTFMYPTPIKPLNGVAIETLVNAIQRHFSESKQVVLHLSRLAKENKLPIQTGACDYFCVTLPAFYKLIHFYDSSGIEKILAGYEFDIVHFHNFFPGVFMLDAFLKKHRIPYIITFRGSCARALRFMYRRKKLKQIIDRAIGYTFLSEYYYRQIVQKLHDFNITLNSHKLHLIPNFKPGFWNAGTSAVPLSMPFQLLIIANIEKRKNLINTLLAIREVKKKYALEVNIYGEVYDSALYDKLKSDFGDEAVFHPAVSNEKIKSLMDKHHALLLLAHEETFGIAYIEAILRMRPVIYSSNAGISSYIRQNNYGIAVKDVTDIGEISAGIIACINNYNNFDFQGNSKFLESEVMKKWAEVYKT